MRFTKFLEYNRLFAEVLNESPEDFMDFYNGAYDYVKNKLVLYPKLFTVMFTGAVDLNKPIVNIAGGDYQFKEIIDVIGQNPVTEKYDRDFDTTAKISFDSLISLSSGINVMVSHNAIYTDAVGSVKLPCVGYLYPPCIVHSSGGTNVSMVSLLPRFLARQTWLVIPDVLVYPLTAAMYGAISLEQQNIGAHNGYMALCNQYLNLRNFGVLDHYDKTNTEVTRVVPIDLL